MGVWRGSDGIEVAAVIVGDRPCLRVSRWNGGQRTLIRYCSDVREVAEHVDLADLTPAPNP
ncbi:hypothetical protein HNP84_008274 [Thermocatellispora tengchongensis]|uniref:Transposase n=1 Tax=Thermocatellispora tengchongensis TaxID=1073253 RepID=A0A840PLL6_9ACTN|nr:hypothetical protein [Thermocatellispora tengchongensis]MBB5138520.1 hypothetical protein [Thermocatellispora tengchongensis]